MRQDVFSAASIIPDQSNVAYLLFCKMCRDLEMIRDTVNILAFDTMQYFVMLSLVCSNKWFMY